MKFGMEVEAFAINNKGEVVKVPDRFPMDACGWLFEMRSQPADNILETIFSLKADIERVTRKLEGYNVGLPEHKKVYMDFSPIKPVSREVRLAARRRNAKGLIEYRNLYGFEFHRNKGLEATAGIHISFTNPVAGNNRYGDSITVNKIFDFATVFRYLDIEFKDVIKAAKRNPGFYEIKKDGRIEYRSLPNNADFGTIEKAVAYATELI